MGYLQADVTSGIRSGFQLFHSKKTKAKDEKLANTIKKVFPIAIAAIFGIIASVPPINLRFFSIPSWVITASVGILIGTYIKNTYFDTDVLIIGIDLTKTFLSVRKSINSLKNQGKKVSRSASSVGSGMGAVIDELSHRGREAADTIERQIHNVVDRDPTSEVAAEPALKNRSEPIEERPGFFSRLFGKNKKTKKP